MKKTFIELLKEYTIKVPSYQRDYAQGRKNPQAKAIRKNLITDIKSVVEDENIPPLDLNFIYGATIEKDFIPVDGQQRLTTLFLLHIYAFEEDKYNNLFFNGADCKFSYQARDTSRDFFSKLAMNRYDIFNNEKILPSEYIKNKTWFLYSWNFDPSINSALQVLNQIYEAKISKINLQKVFLNTDNPRLFFHFEDVYHKDNNKIYEATHDLYLKLNDRGRPLTPFEIFKSKFYTNCPKDLQKELAKKLDNQYTDYFWKIIKPNLSSEDHFDTEEFDKAYIRFFKYFFFTPIWKGKYLETNEENTEYNDTELDLWIYNLKYQEIEKNTYETIMNVLNYITGNATLNQTETIVKNIITEQKPSFIDRALFYALCVYFEDNTEISQLEDWLRINRNLIYNSNVEDEKNYISTCNDIKEISKYKINILKALNEENIQSPHFKNQLEEEKIKAYFMLKNEDHRNIIIQAERELPYFEGKISCLLKYTDNYKKEGYLNIHKFEEVLKRLKEIFNEKGPIDDTQLYQALLGYGDYTLSIGRYKTLCVKYQHDAQHTPSFKDLFSLCGKEVKNLLDTTESVSNLANKAQKEITDQTDWRYCFLNYPKLLEGFTKRKMIEKGKDRYLLNNTKSGNADTSLYLRTLQLIMDKKLIFKWDTREDGKKHLRMKIEGPNPITIEFDKDHFKITNARNKEHIIEGSNLLTDTSNYLSKLEII